MSKRKKNRYAIQPAESSPKSLPRPSRYSTREYRLVQVFVEGYDDVAFWRGIFDDYETEWLKFEISVPPRQDLAKGKKVLLGMIGGGLLADLLGFPTVALLFGALTLTGLPLALSRIPRSGRATGAASRAATSLLSGLYLRQAHRTGRESGGWLF